MDLAGEALPWSSPDPSAVEAKDPGNLDDPYVNELQLRPPARFTQSYQNSWINYPLDEKAPKIQERLCDVSGD